MITRENEKALCVLNQIVHIKQHLLKFLSPGKIVRGKPALLKHTIS